MPTEKLILNPEDKIKIEITYLPEDNKPCHCELFLYDFLEDLKTDGWDIELKGIKRCQQKS